MEVCEVTMIHRGRFSISADADKNNTSDQFKECQSESLCGWHDMDAIKRTFSLDLSRKMKYGI